MFSLKNFITKKEKNTTKIVKSESQIYTEIDLNTLFYVVKYGHEIDLEIKNNDTYEHGQILALGRSLSLEGICIEISQWADWTITISLVDKDVELKVAESSIRNEFIDWNRDSNFVQSYSKLKWVEKGRWCDEILNKINSLKGEIDSKRNQIERERISKKNKEKAIEEEKNMKKRAHFENIYK